MRYTLTHSKICYLFLAMCLGQAMILLVYHQLLSREEGDSNISRSNLGDKYPPHLQLEDYISKQSQIRSVPTHKASQVCFIIQELQDVTVYGGIGTAYHFKSKQGYVDPMYIHGIDEFTCK